MTDQDYRRWAELMDDETAGRSLDAEERAFCAGLERRDETAALEMALIEQLAEDGDEAPDEEAHRMVGEALRAAREPSPEAAPTSLPGRRRPLVMAGVAATAAAAAAILLARPGPAPEQKAAGERASTPRAEVVYASGTVRVGDQPLTVGAAVLKPGEVVATGEGRACVVIDPGIDLCAGSHTRMRVVETDPSERRVELLAGRVTASLDPQPDGNRFAIHAGDVVSTAIGTVFSVARSGRGGEVETIVSKGQVAVSTPRGRRVLQAHERARSEERIRVEGVTRMVEARLSAAMGVTRLWRTDLPATLEVHAPERVTVMLDGEPIGVTPLVTLVPSGSHALAALRDGAPGEARRVHLEAGARHRVSLQPAVASPRAEPDEGAAPAPRETPATTAEPVEVLLRRARSHMLERRWGAAAGAYRALRRAHPGDPEAHAVLVSLGELQLTHLGHPAAALRSFERYLAGGGPLSQEASHGRIRALRTLSRSAQEARAIRRFLQRYPGTPHQTALERRLSTLTDR